MTYSIKKKVNEQFNLCILAPAGKNKRKNHEYHWFEQGIHSFLDGYKKMKEKDKLKEAGKDRLDVVLFIAGETPTQPISLVCSWLKTTLKLISLTCPHNRTLSMGPYKPARRNELVYHVQALDSLYITHNYSIKITRGA